MIPFSLCHFLQLGRILVSFHFPIPIFSTGFHSKFVWNEKEHLFFVYHHQMSESDRLHEIAGSFVVEITRTDSRSLSPWLWRPFSMSLTMRTGKCQSFREKIYFDLIFILSPFPPACWIEHKLSQVISLVSYYFSVRGLFLLNYLYVYFSQTPFESSSSGWWYDDMIK